ncbi:DNA repair protein complementing XP-A cells homolog [Lutzomyia longipalpis]|uniref:DNA repair protein complementing XP-A cells homolog n=1 Tax=Lutzomyia longipalpis TaxID=7200 RepID=UPI002483FD05|nr:DNA repair protein complementing XP-A cells homolog [Lutzomyia longipalpis]
MLLISQVFPQKLIFPTKMSQESSNSGLTDAQKSRIDRNRQKALYLKNSKLVAHPYAKSVEEGEKSVIKIHGSRFVDSGGGFLIEEEVGEGKNSGNQPHGNSEEQHIIDEAIDLPVTYDECMECADKFAESYLMHHFDYPVCDNCRDNDDKHSLITKTDAKKEYLLQDCDLEKREPPLKYIIRKNPHNVRWGEMKLYLHVQIEKRALEVWGSEENLRAQHELRDEKREKSKIKKYNKQMKQLRMDMRSSLYDRTSEAAHIHKFGPDSYNESDDTYTHTCLTCKYTETFEKM